MQMLNQARVNLIQSWVRFTAIAMINNGFSDGVKRDVLHDLAPF
jgi:hypothetical protein